MKAYLVIDECYSFDSLDIDVEAFTTREAAERNVRKRADKIKRENDNLVVSEDHAGYFSAYYADTSFNVYINIIDIKQE